MIHERGYWLSTDETDTHMFDQQLCDEIIRIFLSSEAPTVADIGCGNGAYTKALNEAGFICKGWDGSPLTTELTGGVCEVLDFSQPVDIGMHDIVLCLEVGEHIPVEYEQVFIDNVVKSSLKFIIMSWAIVGQSGYGHFNCRDNDYVISEMEMRGCRYLEETTDQLRLASTLPWFKRTIMVFSKW